MKIELVQGVGDVKIREYIQGNKNSLLYYSPDFIKVITKLLDAIPHINKSVFS